MATAEAMIGRLRELGDPAVAAQSQRFFKTGPGQYGEGDRFLGIRVPVLRKLARAFRGAAAAEVPALLGSPFHEARLLALLMWVDRYRRGTEAERQAIYDAYLTHTGRINNWDLVDVSACQVVGAHLEARERAPLVRLARSTSLWERRIAIVATFHFIRHHDYGDTLNLAERLLGDDHDLIHKATGWMLREVGNRDRAVLSGFLDRHCRAMPRTMLRYAIERYPEPERQAYLRGARRPGQGAMPPTGL